jgi:phosphoglycolate phosphatase
MKEGTIKNFIFDWSGVISDDFMLVYKTYERIFEHYGKKPLSVQDFKAKFRLPYMDFCHEYLGVSHSRELSEIFKRFYTDKGFVPKALEGVEAALCELKKRKKTLIVLSSHSFVSREMEVLFPGKRFFNRIYEDIPNKEYVIVDIVKEMGFSPDDTVYVGDMVHDIRAGKKACVRTAAVLTGYQTREVLEKESPDYFLDTLNDIFREIPL